ncbi:MAG TPA: DUF4186 domain-containing protein [bacterium]|nr:DUF4186 domain-containing protein [bacterium]
MDNYSVEKFENILAKLSKSKFRNSFKLSAKDKNYISSKGMAAIKKHALDFFIKRLSSIYNSKLKDGKQTPFKGHPVFIAQHSLALCCRKCLKKWHNIEENRELTAAEINYCVDLIMYWLQKHHHN